MSTDTATLPRPTGTNSACDVAPRKKSRIWHASAPTSVLAAYESQCEEDTWAAWTEHLVTREQSAVPELLANCKVSPLLWALPAVVDREQLSALIATIQTKVSTNRKREKQRVDQLESWLSNQEQTPHEVSFCLEALAWAYQLPQLAQGLPAGLWWQLVERLVDIAHDSTAIDAVQQPLAHQLAAGELPLVLGYLLPELRACHALRKRARKALNAGIVETLDGQGLPHASNLPDFRELLACWTRTAAIGKQIKGGLWKKRAEIQYSWAVRQALRFSRPDGSQIFAADTACNEARHLFLAGLELAGDREDAAIAAENLPRKWAKDLSKPKNTAKLHDPSFNSTWADTSILRSSWSRKSPSLAASFAGSAFAAELTNQAQVLSTGAWQTEISHAGEELSPKSEWEQLCWVTDEDVDYLELQMKWSGGVTMQRQLLLARKDQFLFVADALLGETAGHWQYRQALPLAENVVFAGEEETREGYLKKNHQKHALVIPPALPEWRVDRRGGSLGLNAAGLEMRLEASGTAMYAPMVIDLKPSRMTQEKTWRQLTVAEHLQIQPADVAAGYRIQLGNKQWLIYRSLARCGNRTLLSHNLVSEFLVARLRRDGEFETLLEIEP